MRRRVIAHLRRQDWTAVFIDWAWWSAKLGRRAACSMRTAGRDPRTSTDARIAETDFR